MGAVATARSSNSSRSLQTEKYNGITGARKERREAALATAKATQFLVGKRVLRLLGTNEKLMPAP